VLADDARDDLEVAETPDADTLVPLGEELRELVELLVLAAADVELEQRQPTRAIELLERPVERLRHSPDLAKAGRVEAGAGPEHAAHLLVLPRRHLLEVLEEPLDDLQCETAAPQEAIRRREVA